MVLLQVSPFEGINPVVVVQWLYVLPPVSAASSSPAWPSVFAFFSSFLRASVTILDVYCSLPATVRTSILMSCVSDWEDIITSPKSLSFTDLKRLGRVLSVWRRDETAMEYDALVRSYARF